MSSSERSGTNLYGMMRAGKSTLGRRLALHLGQPFRDTDDMITERFGRTPADIIAMPGVDFADYQATAIEAYIPKSSEVVATGGSVAMYPDLVKHLGHFGVGIYIDVDPEALIGRLTPEKIAALNNPLNLSIGDLIASRAEMYRAAADHVLAVPLGETEDQTFGRLVDLRASV